MVALLLSNRALVALLPIKLGLRIQRIGILPFRFPVLFANMERMDSLKEGRLISFRKILIRIIPFKELVLCGVIS